MEFPKDYLEKLKAASSAKVRNETEYAFYVNEGRKITGEKYIVLHRRLERAFVGKSMEYLLGYLKRWVHEAEKDRSPAICFNARFKQFREQGQQMQK